MIAVMQSYPLNYLDFYLSLFLGVFTIRFHSSNNINAIAA